ncbi:MAG TPA: aminoglycoside phosphotransferase family protein [Anaerolineales bacterium]|nr:aminoglycoside phosphotransferase family protein [Anaerolineales bacterium]
MNSFLEDLSTFALSLDAGDHKLFDSSVHWVMLANGDADFHDNVIFFGFAERDNDPILVAKVPRLAENGWMLQTEYDHLVELWNCIGEEASHFVPKPIAMTSLQQRPLLMVSYVPGKSLARLSRKAFWGNSDQVSALAQEAAHTLRHLNQLTERPSDPGDVLSPRFAEKAATFRELFQTTSDEDAMLADLVNISETAVGRATHKVIIQGDFWHGNMIRGGKQGGLKLIDWQFARWSADVSMDVYFFLLAGALSASGDVPEQQRARAAFHVLSGWRENVIPAYLSAYGMPERYVLLPQKYGMLMCCVEKAVRPALEFGYSHSDDLIWRHLFAELTSWPDPD